MREVIYTINIESGIGSGSVSILKNGEILDYFYGLERAGKMENLLGKISVLLQKHGIKKTEISKIKYSVYPGSHTGLKIGASIAKGLHVSLKAEIESKDLFECIYKKYSNGLGGNILIVLPVSRTDFAWRFYNKRGESKDSGQARLEEAKPVNLSLENTGELNVLMPVSLLKKAERICQRFAFERLGGALPLEENLSNYLG